MYVWDNQVEAEQKTNPSDGMELAIKMIKNTNKSGIPAPELLSGSTGRPTNFGQRYHTHTAFFTRYGLDGLIERFKASENVDLNKTNDYNVLFVGDNQDELLIVFEDDKDGIFLMSEYGFQLNK